MGGGGGGGGGRERLTDEHGDESTLPFLVTEGVNESVVMFPSCSSSRLHTFTPSAAPAAMAAPSAVVSGIDGLTIRTKG